VGKKTENNRLYFQRVGGEKKTGKGDEEKSDLHLIKKLTKKGELHGGRARVACSPLPFLRREKEKSE